MLSRSLGDLKKVQLLTPIWWLTTVGFSRGHNTFFRSPRAPNMHLVHQTKHSYTENFKILYAK